MGKSHAFSIYLLKEGVSPKDALDTDKEGLEKETHTGNLPKESCLYVKKGHDVTPWWEEFLGLQLNLKQKSHGAILFIKNKKRYFAITFGITSHFLNPYKMESDFGLKTTLNAVDPEKIKSTDFLTPENAKRERIQSSKEESISFFHGNSYETTFKKLIGKVREEYKNIFTNVTGDQSIRISTKSTIDKLPSLLSTLTKIYNKDTYKKVEQLNDLLKFIPVTPNKKVNDLDNELINKLSDKDQDIILNYPEMLDDIESFKYKFTGLKKGPRSCIYECFDINNLYKFINNSNIPLDIRNLQKIKLNLLDNDNEIQKQKSSVIYKCLIAQIDYKNKSYHFCDGNWYEVDHNFVLKIDKRILNACLNNTKYFPTCDIQYEEEGRSYRESGYNEKLGHKENFICLDKRDISPDKQTQVEPCDALELREDHICFIHNKLGNQSSSLSHLFNQGYNSVKLLKLEESSKKKLINLIKNSGKELTQEQIGLINNNKFQVIYGIITDKDKKANDIIPLLSKITLARILDNFRLIDVPCQIAIIKDTVAKPPKEKTKKTTASK